MAAATDPSWRMVTADLTSHIFDTQELMADAVEGTINVHVFGEYNRARIVIAPNGVFFGNPAQAQAADRKQLHEAIVDINKWTECRNDATFAAIDLSCVRIRFPRFTIEFDEWAEKLDVTLSLDHLFQSAVAEAKNAEKFIKSVQRICISYDDTVNLYYKLERESLISSIPSN